MPHNPTVSPSQNNSSTVPNKSKPILQSVLSVVLFIIFAFLAYYLWQLYLTEEEGGGEPFSHQTARRYQYRNFQFQYSREYQVKEYKNNLALTVMIEGEGYGKIIATTRLYPDINYAANNTKKNSYGDIVKLYRQQLPNAQSQILSINRQQITELSLKYSCPQDTDGITPGQAINERTKCGEYYAFYLLDESVLLIRTIIFSYSKQQHFYDLHRQILDSISVIK